MKKHFLHIIILLCIQVMTYAQVVDTTININSWVLKHHYSRFEDVMLDTSIHDLHLNYNPLNRNGIAYENLGIIGSGAQNMDLFDQPESDFFLFGQSAYPYMATPDRTIFFNTRMPFTEINYTSMLGTDWNEETIRFMHTQNMDPFSNIGLDFELLSGKPLYDNQESRVTKFTIFGNRTKEKYAAFGTFHFNRFNTRENGGLASTEGFRQGVQTDPFLYNVNLYGATANYTNLKFFYTQKFMISEKVYETDTLGVTTDSGTNFSFNHQLVIERNNRFFKDDTSLILGDFYNNFYYNNANILDSVVQDRLVNTFQFILGDPYTDPLSARVYAGHEITRYGQLSPVNQSVFNFYDTLSYEPLQLDSVFKDTAIASFSNRYFNELFVGFHLAGPPENLWYWTIDGKYYLAGYYRNNFNLNATFARTVFSSTRLGVRGSIENRNVSYYHNHYSSSFFRWQNDFKASQLIQAEAFLNGSEEKLDLRLTAGTWTNYLYWNEEALPAQAGQAILLVSGRLSSHLRVSGFHSVNKILFQYTSSPDIIRIPMAAIHSSNYYERDFFEKALKAQVGFDLYITSAYQAHAYMPATGVFYLQDQETVGGFPFVDVYLGIRVKRTRIFISYNNGLAGLLSNNYFTTAGYASKPPFFRFGVAWTFYD